ncbi:10829_t:CDS:2, partial [Funneliformis geosporum]
MVSPFSDENKHLTLKYIARHYQPSKKLFVGLDDIDLLEFDFGRALEIWFNS